MYVCIYIYIYTWYRLVSYDFKFKTCLTWYTWLVSRRQEYYDISNYISSSTHSDNRNNSNNSNNSNISRARTKVVLQPSGIEKPDSFLCILTLQLWAIIGNHMFYIPIGHYMHALAHGCRVVTEAGNQKTQSLVRALWTWHWRCVG